MILLRHLFSKMGISLRSFSLQPPWFTLASQMWQKNCCSRCWTKISGTQNSTAVVSQLPSSHIGLGNEISLIAHFRGLILGSAPPQHCIGKIGFDFEGYVICFYMFQILLALAFANTILPVFASLAPEGQAREPTVPWSRHDLMAMSPTMAIFVLPFGIATPKR